MSLKLPAAQAYLNAVVFAPHFSRLALPLIPARLNKISNEMPESYTAESRINIQMKHLHSSMQADESSLLLMILS